MALGAFRVELSGFLALRNAHELFLITHTICELIFLIAFYALNTRFCEAIGVPSREWVIMVCPRRARDHRSLCEISDVAVRN